MIRGVGIDLVEVERVRGALARWGERFLARVFAPEEVAEARQGGEFVVSLAARFAAKEAAYKAVREALGVPLPLRSIVVSGGRGRAPRVVLAGRQPREVAALTWWCSLTHTDGLACAVVVAEDSRESEAWRGTGATTGAVSDSRSTASKPGELRG